MKLNEYKRLPVEMPLSESPREECIVLADERYRTLMHKIAVFDENVKDYQEDKSDIYFYSLIGSAVSIISAGCFLSRSRTNSNFAIECAFNMCDLEYVKSILTDGCNDLDKRRDCILYNIRGELSYIAGGLRNELYSCQGIEQSIEGFEHYEEIWTLYNRLNICGHLLNSLESATSGKAQHLYLEIMLHYIIYACRFYRGDLSVAVSNHKNLVTYGSVLKENMDFISRIKFHELKGMKDGINLKDCVSSLDELSYDFMSKDGSNKEDMNQILRRFDELVK